jgi:hypothetical protein
MTLLALLSIVHAEPAPQPLACPAGIEVALAATANAGIAGYEAREEATVRDAARRVEAAFACQRRPLSPEEAVAIHQLFALRAFLDKDLARVGAELAAVRSIAPSTPFNPAWAPAEGHPLAQAWAAAADPRHKAALPWPVDPAYEAVVDGARGAGLPETRAALLQITNARAETVWSAVWTANGAAPLLPEGLHAAPPATARSTRGRWIAAGTCTVGAGLFYGFALADHNAWNQASEGASAEAIGAAGWAAEDWRTEMLALQRSNHRNLIVSGALAASALGLGASAVWAGTF